MLIATQHHLLKESLVRKKLYFTLLVTLCHAGLSGPCMMAGSAGEGHPEATGGVLGSSSPQEAQSHLIEEIKLPAGLGGCQEFRPRQREGRFLKTQVSAGTFCHQDWMLSSCSSSLGGVGGSLRQGASCLCWDSPALSVRLSMCPLSKVAAVRGTTQCPSCRTERGIGSPSRDFCGD